MPRHRSALVVASLGLGAATVAVAWWATGGLSAFGDRPLDERLAASPSLEAQEVTASLCSGARGQCVEGWRTAVGDFLRYGSADEAEYWELVLGEDALRNGAVVLDTTEVELSLAERRQAIDVLFADRDWR